MRRPVTLDVMESKYLLYTKPVKSIGSSPPGAASRRFFYIKCQSATMLLRPDVDVGIPLKSFAAIALFLRSRLCRRRVRAECRPTALSAIGFLFFVAMICRSFENSFSRKTVAFICIQRA